MDIFPFFGDVEVEDQQQVPPLYKEVAWNYERNAPIIENGDFKIVEGIEAIKSWVYRTLQVKRYKYLIYTNDFGHELEKLFGNQYTQSLIHAESKRYLEECILINPYITSITNIETTFKDGLLMISCNLNTIYGEAEMEVNVGV